MALIEAGPAAWRDPWIRIPAGFARLYASGKYDWQFHTEAEPGLDGRSIHWPRGKVVGGSGAVNGLVFLRGVAARLRPLGAVGRARLGL